MKKNGKIYDTKPLTWSELEPYFLDHSPGTLNLSSGNPIVQEEVVKELRAHYKAVIESPDFSRIVYRYNDPRGDYSLRETLANLYAVEYGFDISAENIIITAGSQAAFYYISELTRRRNKGIYFPCGPEYPGYQTLPDAVYSMAKPGIRELDRHFFDYRLLPEAYRLPADTLFVMLACPGNPTGKVLSPEEIRRLQEACTHQQAYLMLDGAYTAPVPGITFQDIEIPWSERMVFTTSLSKAGLAGERLGVIIAPTELVKEFIAIQSKVNILSSRLVQFVVNRMLNSGVYQRLSREVIRPAYKQRHEIARKAIENALPGDLPYYIFQAGGSPFMWIWFDQLPVSTNQLFFQLLEEKLIIMPSSVFYLPQLRDWPHAHQCFRIGLVEPPAVIREAMEILGRKVSGLYR